VCRVFSLPWAVSGLCRAVFFAVYCFWSLPCYLSLPCDVSGLLTCVVSLSCGFFCFAVFGFFAVYSSPFIHGKGLFAVQQRTAKVQRTTAMIFPVVFRGEGRCR
jgi:hypothetical protein